MRTQPILQDKSIVVNTAGSWPVVDLEKSWNAKYLIYGAFFANEKGNWTQTRPYPEKDKLVGFSLLDPVRWRIPCEYGLLTAAPGWPTLHFITKSQLVVTQFLETVRPKCSNPTRGEIAADGTLIIRFWAEDYAPCFRFLRPLKETTKKDKMYLPEFCASYPEHSLPDIGVPIRKQKKGRNG